MIVYKDLDDLCSSDIYNYYLKLEKDCVRKLLKGCIVISALVIGITVMLNLIVSLHWIFNMFLFSAAVFSLKATFYVYKTKYIEEGAFKYYYKDGYFNILMSQAYTVESSLLYVNDDLIQYVKSYPELYDLLALRYEKVRIYFDCNSCPILIHRLPND